ncbi:WD repeat-containing [Hirsutella rhossiliensis]
MSAPGLDSAPGSAVQYAYMFEKNKGPTKQLDALLRAIARHTILELGDKTDSYLTPTKLAAFYQAVGGDYDTLFVDTPYASLSLIWQATGCQHTLQPTHDDFAPPIIPALTMRGFSRWESLEILLGPEEHVPFMHNSTLSPSSSIREVLAHENVDVLATFLEQRFTQIARGDYAWMAELRDVGYTHAEIAQLLYERTHDSPWIYFEPKDIPSAEVMPGHHLDGCAHRISGTLPGICKTPSDATGHQLRLTRLDFSLGGRIINYLRDLDHRRADDPGRQHTISLLRTQSQEIISQAVGDSYEHNINGADVFHMSSLALQFLCMPAASSSIDMKQEILIGGLVTVNTLCGNDEGTCWKASSRRFEELGTYSSYSEPIEYQLGLQGGPDHLAITTNKVWAKRRGKTVKARNLERDDFMLVPFLDFYWGVRVSFCTGVAQRVLLRQLVADLLPAFAKSLTSKQMKAWWAELESENRILGIFHDRQQPLSDWLCSLSEDHYRFVLGLIRLVLGTLQDTGLSPEGGHFVVAWPQDGVVNRCFRMSLDEHNKWTPMLADSDDCATFAYMSNVCLEAGAIVCRGPNPTWQDRICLLETAVLCPTSAEPWTLCHEQTYFFHKLDNNLFWVKAQRDAAREALPVSLMRLISVQSLPQDIRYRLLFKEEQKRQRRLREKDLQSVPAELVLILSRKM